jgi:signal peptidase I
MNRSRALRSTLVSVVLVLLCAAAWLTFAPTRFGGSTEYVSTRGISMAPRFHTGDLALIRPSDDYRVGDVVAYRSTLLRTVILHRIIGRDGDRYVLKGDHNDFVDPTHPARSDLVGKLWLRVPHGGVVLSSLQRPYVMGGLAAAAILMLLLGSAPRRRRRKQPLPAPATTQPAAAPIRRPAPVPHVIGGMHLPPPKPLTPPAEVTASEGATAAEPQTPVAGGALVAVSGNTRPGDRRSEGVSGNGADAPPSATTPSIDGRQILIGSAITAAIATAAALVAFATPTTKAATTKSTYTEKVDFGYHATTARTAGPVYPGGDLSTGDPVFVRLVDRVNVSVAYRFSADARHVLGGTMSVILRISSPSGWTRDLPLAQAKPFAGDRADAEVTLDLKRLRRLTDRVETLSGMPPGGTYSLAVIPRIRATGTVAGRPVATSYAPQLGFQLDRLQLRQGATTPKATGQAPSRSASVAVPHSAANAWHVRGHGISVTLARWIALGALLLALLGAPISRMKRFRRPVDPSGRVNARYGHLLVPIAAVPLAGRTPIEVTTIDALVALAERGERLILHHHGLDADTYLVDDGGTLFRFRIERDSAPAPLVLVAA